MRNKIIFALVIVGAIAALVSACMSTRPKRRVPPAFSPAPNPFAAGIYASGIIESYQSNGENVNVFPEVAGTVVEVLVSEGQKVERGAPLFRIDDRVQRATVEQQRSQALAARALYEQLQAQPRPETLAVSRAQAELARANWKSAHDSYEKLKHSFEMDERSVSREQLDTAANASRAARANVDVAERQLALTRAGAWSYDVRQQHRQYQASSNSYASASALLEKYTVRAPADGVVLSIRAAVGSYSSPAGTYGTYTQDFGPALVMSHPKAFLNVRCYVDEILIPRLPPKDRMQAKMFVRGTTTSIPLEFVRVQPYVTPKIQLTAERTERVDVRVLPVIFRFTPPESSGVYPGQLVDVYVGAK